jgi:ProP effector
MNGNQHSRAAVYAALDLLCEVFPACFKQYEKRRLPLKVGIHHNILAALAGAITPQELGLALAIYVGNKSYRSGLVAGAVRIDLNGQPAGTVTPEQAAPAPPRAPRKVSSPAPVVPKIQAPAPDGRLSLTGLRAAARARREAGSAS